MSARRPHVAIVNTNEEIVLALRELLDLAGYEVATGHIVNFKSGQANYSKFIDDWKPRVIVYDVAPPYESNWHFFEQLVRLDCMKGVGVVLTTTNKKHLTEIAGPLTAIELVGKPEDMGEIVNAVKRALVRARAA